MNGSTLEASLLAITGSLNETLRVHVNAFKSTIAIFVAVRIHTLTKFWGALMLRATGCTVFVALIMVVLTTTAGTATEGPWLQNYFDANGGCGPHRLAFNRLVEISIDVRRGTEKGRDPDLFGRAASEWSDQDIADALDFYTKCELQIDVRSRRCKVGSPGCGTEPDKVTITLAKDYERNLREIVSAVRERLAVRHRQEAAKQAQEAAMAIRKQKMAEDADRHSQQELIERTARDHAAATEAARRAEIEEPKIAEAVKQAEDARKARDGAERRLAEIRSRIETENAAAKSATEQARLANNSREQTLREETAKEADARLPGKCQVRLEQFNKVRFGMQLREVNQLFGCRGRQTSGTRISGFGTFSTYTWDGGTDLSVVTATFKGDSLQSKAQIGLE